MSNSPSTHWGAQPFLGKLGNAGMLVYCKCYGCRKSRTYLASDLAKCFGANRVVGEIFGRCPYCDFGGNWSERYRYPSHDDVINRTVIRRFKGWKHTAIWADEEYSAPEPPEEKPSGMWGG
ncbi:MAG: hypothetical protein KIS86_17080 [Devosia sp.]|nr:hypothetical protein [Devosia sp.]